jgi:4-aminobutyrate aminotransferase-like enzyme
LPISSKRHGSAGSSYGNALRISPPLVATKDDVDQALEILDYTFAEVQEMV